MLDEILVSWAESKPPVSPVGAFIRLKLLPHDTTRSNPRLKAFKEYVGLFNAKNEQQEPKTYEWLLNKLKDTEILKENCREEKEMLDDAAEIKRIDDYLELLEQQQKPSKRKPESLLEDARDPKRPRSE